MSGNPEGISQSPLQRRVIFDHQYAHLGPLSVCVQATSIRSRFPIFTRAPDLSKRRPAAALSLGRRALAMRCTGGSILCLIIVAGILLPATGAATCGWSVIDHRVQQDESGLWNPDIYRAVFQILTAAQVGGAVWEGAETRIGKTMWQGID